MMTLLDGGYFFCLTNEAETSKGEWAKGKGARDDYNMSYEGYAVCVGRQLSS